jgi:hypothetical protein
MSITTLTSQILSLNGLVEEKLLKLRVGFERLEGVLGDAEEQISTWGGNKRWIHAGLTGLLIGTVPGIARWILIGMSMGELR